MKKITLPSLDARNVALFIAVACVGMFTAYQGFRFLENPLRQQLTLEHSAPQPLSVPVKEGVPAPAAVSVAASQAVEKTQRQPTLVLNGLLCSEDEDLALINGRVVKEGDTIEGAVVRSINEESVELEFERKLIILRVQGY